MEYRAGSLVRLRGREWVVLPSGDEELMLLKPLGGSDEDITGIFLPLEFEEDAVEPAEFPLPGEADLGDLSSARILYNAARLSFRSGAGPFRSLAKLSFRPRSYQMVPMIMALKQKDPIRLIIADDVGVGKTIEALLILKELLERGEIKRFAIVVLPHLCEQWQQELKDKFSIDAVIIRTNTQAALDREIYGDISTYHYYPYQIISIDYIKSDSRREMFIQDGPEFIIVDEAHTCSKPTGTSATQQQRHRLIHDISKRGDRHLVMLTATPHSGKAAQFNSLLGLLDEKYLDLDLPKATRPQREELARYYVQRRRSDVQKWIKNETLFPQRDAGEFHYELSPAFQRFYQKIWKFAFGLVSGKSLQSGKQRFRYWSALTLLCGVMSSPAAGVKMLENRKAKGFEREEFPHDEVADEISHPLLAEDQEQRDDLDTHILEQADWSKSEIQILDDLAKELVGLIGVAGDYKIAETIRIVMAWLGENYNTVIFCRFIETAKYVGEVLSKEFQKEKISATIEVVTSEDADDLRKARIEGMKDKKKKVLIATDCLSEGINLQDQFTAVLHYDLPWNPNRLEQREGRIDRFGQTKKVVKGYLLYGKNNPIDSVVLRVLLRKVREIRKSIGISIPFPEDSQSLMDAVLHEVLLHPGFQEPLQLALEFPDIKKVEEKELIAGRSIQKAADREKVSRSIFAQHAIKAEEIEEDLELSDQAIGKPQDVEDFVTGALGTILGVQIDKNKQGYVLYPVNLPESLHPHFPGLKEVKVSFHSPTPGGYKYMGRNHAFVEQLCSTLLAESVSRERFGPSRAAVISSHEVSVKTTLLLFRVRNVIESRGTGNQVIAEEMLLWGYEGNPEDGSYLDTEQVEHLMSRVQPASNLPHSMVRDALDDEIQELEDNRGLLDDLAYKRSEALIEAHERFRKVVGGKRFKVVEPVLPMDLLGIYIVLPVSGGN